MQQFKTSHNSTPPPTLLPVLQKVKSVYILWHSYLQALPKTHRHSLGQRIDTFFIEIIESIATASYIAREEKLPFVRASIRKLDTIKILMMILWETKSLDDKKYIAISMPIDEIGRMLGGWSGHLQKQQTLPKKPSGEK